MDKLTQIRKYSVVVADTGDIDFIQKYTPQDATTNPSIILKTILDTKYKHFFDQALNFAKKKNIPKLKQVSLAADILAVMIGQKISELIKGYVSTEVDSRLSFNVPATVKKAQFLIDEYEKLKVPREKILIKIAGTWEGIKAAEQLKKLGINCNITLVFSLAQAIAAADAGVFLISPFVGRILDWYTKHEPKEYNINNDPGVISVTEIYNHYKKYGFNTIVMAASFRKTYQIEGLAGCDRLTISPALMEELSKDKGDVIRVLDEKKIQKIDPKTHTKSKISEDNFRFELNQSAVASDKLSEGIRMFVKDQQKLEDLFLKEL